MQQALKCRRSAKRIRVFSVVMWALAGMFAALSVVKAFVGFGPSVLPIFTCSLIIAACAFSVRMSAGSMDDLAARWDRMAGGRS